MKCASDTVHNGKKHKLQCHLVLELLDAEIHHHPVCGKASSMADAGYLARIHFLARDYNKHDGSPKENNRSEQTSIQLHNNCEGSGIFR